MRLPPIVETPTVVMRFTPKATEQLITLCAQRLQDCGVMILHRHDLANRQGTVLVLTTTQEVLEGQAERVHLMKRTNDTQVIEYFSSRERHRFRSDNPASHFDSDGIFTAQDRTFLTMRLVKQVTVYGGVSNRSGNRQPEKSSPLSKLLDEEYHATSRLKIQLAAQNEYHGNPWKKVLSQRRPTKMEEAGEKSDTLWHVLTSFALVDLITAVHQPALRDIIVAKTTLAPLWNLQPPVHLIHDYFGYEIAFYFAWIGFLTQWYAFPGVLGLLVYAFRLYRGDTIDNDEYTPFYGLVCFIWAILFLRFWEREENRLAYQWGTYSLSNFERQKLFATRPEFRGILRLSPISGEEEIYYPSFKRRLTYIFSAIVTIVMLGVAFGVMILSLNLQGYIHPSSNPARWGNDNPHPFHVPYLAVLAEKGNVLDAGSWWRSLIPVIIHVACISALNSVYRLIAERLTDLENHETELNHNNSIVLKRFLFEAFDCYVALFYLAFYERDVSRLRGELVSIFQIDTLRRLFLECVVPMATQSIKSGHFILPDSWHSSTHQAAALADILEDLDKDEYEQFDDYMEILIQLGYVTLFASAYPLASLVAIFANWVEIRTDAVKLSRLCRRPDIHRATGIGTWRTLMATIVWTSALTNCLITGFTSDQLEYYLPSLYIQTETGYSDMGHKNGWVLVFIIFGLERVLIVIGLLIYAIVPAVPEDVHDELERRQYLRMKAKDKEDAKKLEKKEQ